MRARDVDRNLPHAERFQETTRLLTGTLIGLIPILFLLALAGCSSMPPAQEMSDARQAIHAAREAEAERYAPEHLEQAERFLEHAASDLEEGEYERARRNARAAKEAAVTARDQALAKSP